MPGEEQNPDLPYEIVPSVALEAEKNVLGKKKRPCIPTFRQINSTRHLRPRNAART